MQRTLYTTGCMPTEVVLVYLIDSDILSDIRSLVFSLLDGSSAAVRVDVLLPLSCVRVSLGFYCTRGGTGVGDVGGAGTPGSYY